MRKKPLLVIGVILFLIFACVPSIVNLFNEQEISTSVDTTYQITNYTVDMQVSNDNKVLVEETIVATFNIATKHGIYRNIPLENTITINENGKGKKITQSVEISNIKGNQNAVKSYSNKNVLIRFGSENFYQPMNTPVTFKLEYTMNLGRDYAKTFDMFYVNLLGIDWSCSIDEFNYSVTLPKEFDSSKLSMFKGKYGETNQVTDFAVSGNQITGTISSINPHNAVTISLTLPENYFENAKYVTYSFSTFCLVLSVIFACATIILFFIKPKKETMVCPVEFYAPDNLNPVDVSLIYNGKISTKDISSLIIYFASKKYLKIDNKEEGIILTKIKDINAKKSKSYEIELFEALFQDGDTINLSEIENESKTITYIDANGEFASKTKNSVPKTIFSAVPKAEMLSPIKTRYNKTSVTFATICVIFSLVSTIAYILGLGLYHIGNSSFIIVIVAIISISAITFFEFQIFKSKKTWSKVLYGILISAYAILYLLIMIFYTKNVSYTHEYYNYIIAVTSLLPAILSIPMISYTTEQTKMLGRVLGFKNFLLTCEKSRMELLLKDNPEYFYDVLPYAYVFGITDTFIKKFESLGLDIPSNSYFNVGLMDYIMFTHVLNVNLTSLSSQAIASNISNTSGGSSGGFGGFSSSGGGFSGGGFGGGGGGSW